MPSEAPSIRVLVLYDSRYVLEELARAVGEGVDSVAGAAPLLRRLDDAVPDDLFDADALILGSPNWSGVTGKMKDWLDRVGDVWAEGQLEGKVGAAFTAGASRNAGIEFTLWSLLHWMLAGGMIVVGLPFNETMRETGSYYGATASGSVQEADREQARALGRRVAETALRLAAH